jgi:hypothetical protein
MDYTSSLPQQLDDLNDDDSWLNYSRASSTRRCSSVSSIAVSLSYRREEPTAPSLSPEPARDVPEPPQVPETPKAPSSGSANLHPKAARNTRGGNSPATKTTSPRAPPSIPETLLGLNSEELQLLRKHQQVLAQKSHQTPWPKLGGGSGGHRAPSSRTGNSVGKEPVMGHVLLDAQALQALCTHIDVLLKEIQARVLRVS